MFGRFLKQGFWVYLFMAVLCFQCIGAGFVNAGEAGKEEAYKIEEVVVTEEKVEERLSAELKNYGHQVTVIRKEQISQSGYVDLYQAIESLVPGLFISLKNGRGDYARQYLHGSDNILWLVDGVRINNRLYGKGYLDTIGLYQIERIEVLYGGEGLFYGTEATGGVINIITKPVTQFLSGEIGAGYGSYNAREIHGHISNSWGSHSLQAFASHDAWDGFQPFGDEVYQRMANADPEDREYYRNNFGAKYRGELSSGGNAVFNLHVQRNTGKFDWARPDEHNAVNDRTQDMIIAKFDHELCNDFSYYIKSFLHRWWTDYTRQRLNGTYVYKDAPWGFQDWGINFLSSYRFMERQELLIGLDYQNYYGEDQVTDIYTESEQVGAIFVQYRPYFPIFPNLKTALGVRYNQTEDVDKTVWSASGRIPVLTNLSFRFNVGTSFILPTAEQLWINDNDSGKYGNPDLKPQESFNTDIGLEGKYGLFTYGIGYFQQQVKDRIVFTESTYKNVEEEVKIWGYELSAGLGPWHDFSFGAHFTATRAEQDGSDGQIDRVPEYVAKFNIGWQKPSDRLLIGVDISARYIGTMTDYSTEYGSYWLSDASSFVSFGEQKRHRLTLRLENILDEEYASQLYRGKDALGQIYVYEGSGIPFNAMLTYSYIF